MSFLRPDRKDFFYGSTTLRSGDEAFAINQAIFDLQDIKAKSLEYNKSDKIDEAYEDYLEYEKQRLTNFLTGRTMGANVKLLKR
jgi:hypothetical protein